MMTRAIWASVAALLMAVPLAASEPMPVYPELAGLKALAVVLDYHFSGLDRELFKREIKERLIKAGFRIAEGDRVPVIRIIIETSLYETPSAQRWPVSR
jgi:hypothetical protein